MFAGSTKSRAVLDTAPLVAVIVAEVCAATPAVPMLIVADVAPVGTVTVLELGTAAELLLDRLTTRPPDGAGELSFTEPAAPFPPMTDVGRLTEESGDGSIVRTAVLVTEPAVDVIVAEAALETALVVIVKVPSFAPAGTVMVAGTLANEVLLDRLTTKPCGPLLAARVAEPVEGLPPITGFGLADNEDSTGAFTVNVVVLVAPFSVAEIVTTESASTPSVSTVKLPEVAPPATDAELGTIATEGLLLVKGTAIVKEGAVPTFTVPLVSWPP